MMTAIMAHAKSTLIRALASKTLTGTATNVIPTASASILVATAIINIVLTSKSGFTSSAGENASLIILPPIRDSNINATHGATIVINLSKREPTRYPIRGMIP